jgi:hypothetical protein
MKPGKIYIPTVPFNFGEIIKPGPSGRNELARFIDKIRDDIENSPSEKWELTHFKLDFAEVVHIVAGIVESTTDVELGIAGLGLEVAGPFMTLAGTWLYMGGGVLGAVDHNKQVQGLRGFSYGVVLGANGASNEWIRSGWFTYGQDGFFHVDQYQEYVNQYKLAYRSGRNAGLTYGRLLNGPEAAALMKMLSRKAGRDDDDYITYWDRAGGELPLMDFVKWKKEDFATKHEDLVDGQKVNYYTDCADQFRWNFLPTPD